jgi:ectoine hydroxylase-related dioxygenase (phytanoyl-CoA dioxygenase family)
MLKNYKYYTNKFSKDGYVVIKNFFNQREINDFEKQLLSTYSKYLNVSLNKKNIHSTVLSNESNGNHDSLYKALISYTKKKPFKSASKKLTKLSKLFFNKNFKPIASGMAIGINKSKRTAYEWHQEKPYYKEISTIHYQFPILNLCNRINGTMSVLAGSHNLGFIKEVVNLKFSKKSINSFVPKRIKQIKKKYPEKFINMKLTDVVLFNENIVHRSNSNISNKVRFAGIIRLIEK